MLFISSFLCLFGRLLLRYGSVAESVPHRTLPVHPSHASQPRLTRCSIAACPKTANCSTDVPHFQPSQFLLKAFPDLSCLTVPKWGYRAPVPTLESADAFRMVQARLPAL
jgi:hypothetical protein